MVCVSGQTLHLALLQSRYDPTFWANINHFRLGITRRSSVYHQCCLRINEKNDGTYLAWEVIYPFCFLRRSFENTSWHSVAQHRGEHEYLQMMLLFWVDLVSTATMYSCLFLVLWSYQMNAMIYVRHQHHFLPDLEPDIDASKTTGRIAHDQSM